MGQTVYVSLCDIYFTLTSYSRCIWQSGQASYITKHIIYTADCIYEVNKKI